MQPSSAEGAGGDVGQMLKRYGPIAIIAIIVIVVIVVIASSGGDDPVADTPEPEDSTPEASEPEVEVGQPEPEARVGVDGRPLRDDVIPLDWAQQEGIDGEIDWGPRCDVERGTIAIPDPFAVVCMAPFEGDNGGATAQGVTADSIKIVWYLAQDTDPILAYITSAVTNDDTNAQEEETMRGFIELYETYYETYGRSVDLVVYTASGTVDDAGAAIADAKVIVEDIKPFMVWGGPSLTNAFAEELHANGIPCIGCTVGVNYDYYEERPGLAYTVGKGGEQLDLMVAEYVGKKLAGDPAIHAGDESMHDTERVFGRIWLTTGESSVIANERFEANLADYGVEITESQSYVLDPGSLQESAATIISRMKAAGVTSVILSTDPIAPRDMTIEATVQNYFPEWIVTGSVLVDTTAFSRSYDQTQWANAFGISNLSTRVAREKGGAFALYEWFHGERPPADDTVGLISPTPQTFYSFLQGVGPELTIESFNEVIFNGAPADSRLTSPAISWGAEGLWPENIEPDYRGVDDVSEIWWDVDQEGLDEIDNEGAGMWRWVDGGQRYKFGEFTDDPPKAFVMEGSVDIYPDRPAEEQYPGTYDSLKGS